VIPATELLIGTLPISMMPGRAKSWWIFHAIAHHGAHVPIMPPSTSTHEIAHIIVGSQIEWRPLAGPQRFPVIRIPAHQIETDINQLANMVVTPLERASFDLAQFRLPPFITYVTLSTENDILEIIQTVVNEIPNDPFANYDAYSKPNWDARGAEPITPETIRYAKKLLALTPDTFGSPHIAAGADGSIGFYWSSDEAPFRSFCIDIGPGEKWRAYWRLRDGTFDKVTPRPIDHTTAATIKFVFGSLSG
jgi:hypothetical protein